VSDTVLFADYSTAYHIILEKHPMENTVGRLIVDTDTYTGTETVRREFWWEEGSIHRIEHTASDSLPALRYDFDRWNDGLTTPARVYGPVAHSDSLAALYLKRVKCRLTKSPAENYGNLYVNGVVYSGVGAVNFWHDFGSALILGASKYDVNEDSIYTFDHWDLAGSPTDSAITIPLVSVPDTFVAIYTGQKIHVSIEIGQHGEFPNDSIWWLIPDSLDFAEERIMERQDSIRIVSYSNVPIELGLNIEAIYDVSDDWIIDPYWAPAYTPGINKFSLYAQFTSLSTPPVTWSRINDYVKDSPFWATSTKFGPGGYNIPPEDTPGNWTMLWFKFCSPIASVNSQHTRCIQTNLLAKLYLP